MRSIKEIFVIGHGPSSSHTMGPAFACEYILKKYPNAHFINVTLYGSLALTGKGHLTDYIINLKLKDIPHVIQFNTITRTKHPNTMRFVIETEDKKTFKENIISVGGGTILTKDSPFALGESVYPHKHLKDILKYCENAKYELPWLHVYNTDDSGVLEQYAIQGFPTKIIVGPDGKIVKTIIGEDPAFYTLLDKLFK